jgi:hypothetical protein
MPLLSQVPDWVWWALSLLSIFTFIGSLIVLRFLIARIPPDYFTPRHPPATPWADRHPAVRLTLLVIKNVLGSVLIIAGFVMLFTPGQGILSILVGVSLLNIPGKRALERRIVSNPVVLRALNSVRARAGRAPLVLD